MSEPRQRIVCLYHINCFDGLGAAYAVASAMSESNVEFHAVDYRDPAPDLKGAAVIIVDFSYDIETMQRLVDECDAMIFLDHHDRSDKIVEQLHQYVSENKISKALHFGYDANKSGAVMAWEFFHPHRDTPPVLRCIGDRDLWKFELAETRAVIEGLSRWGMELDVWIQKLKDPYMAFDECLQIGTPLIEKLDADVDLVIKMTRRSVNLFGDLVPLINVPKNLTSEAVGRLAKDQPYAIGYYDDATHRVFSLRSRKGDGTNVRELAETMGGGGHDNAAGFTVPRSHEWAKL